MVKNHLLNTHFCFYRAPQRFPPPPPTPGMLPFWPPPAFGGEMPGAPSPLMSMGMGHLLRGMMPPAPLKQIKQDRDAQPPPNFPNFTKCEECGLMTGSKAELAQHKVAVSMPFVDIKDYNKYVAGAICIVRPTSTL